MKPSIQEVWRVKAMVKLSCPDKLGRKVRAMMKLLPGRMDRKVRVMVKLEALPVCTGMGQNSMEFPIW